ncbi:type I restriction enzyme S subunit [Algoriphagus boseongensis]|uniref:Type I restriction enzyme S subunit n=1 Tax=Algoriphagus boseongensis TaxID=1442587 RepID=A0A4R6T5R8_9BACT|nr:restriction endonuclease subunit S [Algoriphagus boseongensis]TDQ18250.1 type I restriction enzyme S subunit [Algoriphagus boseongensis]
MKEERLPKGWKELPLIDLLEVLETGSRPKGGVQGILNGIPSLGGEHLDYNGNFKFDKLKYIPDEFAQKMKRGKIQEDDVLIVKDGATTGKTSYVSNDFPFENAYVNEHVFICRPTKLNSGKFISYFLRSREGQIRILENFTGSAQGGINQKFAKNTIIPIPPLPEQKRIVSRLDAIFGHLDVLREKLDRIPELLKNFRQQVLTQAVTGDLTREWRIDQSINQDLSLEEGQKIINLKKEIYKNESANFLDKLDDSTKIDTSGDLFSEDWISVNPSFISAPERYSIGIGPFGSNLKVSDYTTEGHPLIFVRNVIANNFKDLDPKFVSKAKFVELIPHSVKSGDLLITKMGTPPGDCEIYPENSKDGIITSDVLKVRVWKEYFVPKFYKFAISSKLVKEQIEGITKGVAHQKISLKRFKEIQLPFPTKNEQQEIVKRVDALFGIAEKIEFQYQSLKAKIDQMPQAVLAKAFRGELVGQEGKEYVREVGEVLMAAESNSINNENS